MRNDYPAIEDKLRSKNAALRNATITQAARDGDELMLLFLFDRLFRAPMGNEIVLALRTAGKAGNCAAIAPVIKWYGTAGIGEQKLMLETLVRLGVFDKFIPGAQAVPNILDPLWALLFSETSAGLEALLQLSPKEFDSRLQFALLATRHWRK